MTLYRVSILDHDCLDYVVHVCADGYVWCFERYAISRWFHERKPPIKEVYTNDRLTAKGVLLPYFVAQMECSAVRYKIREDDLAYLLRQQSRGRNGIAAERIVEKYIRNEEFRPTFYKFIRRASQKEDRIYGVDMWVVSDVSERSGVQVKFDGPAATTGNFFVQLETESVLQDWNTVPANV